jgi:hypothetical protein
MLRIYTLQDADAFLSDGDSTCPFRVTLDGRDTSSIERKLFVRNEDPTRYYTDISLDVVDKGGDIFANESHGFKWKLSAGDIQPRPATWVNIPASNSLPFSDVGSSSLPDTYTYYSFWVRVELPRGHRAMSVKSVVFRLSSKEYLVDV